MNGISSGTHQSDAENQLQAVLVNVVVSLFPQY